MTRDDWKSLSGILLRYEEMILSGDWQAEPEARRLLAAWLRDHDQPHPVLEGTLDILWRSTSRSNVVPPRVEVDRERGLVTFFRAFWFVSQNGTGLGAIYSLHGQDVGNEFRLVSSAEPAG